MFCINCGKKISDNLAFCPECGDSAKSQAVTRSQEIKLDSKWWLRTAKVIYIFFNLSLSVIIPSVWYINSSTFIGYYLGQYQYEDTYGKAFGESLLTLIIFVVILRLIKLTFLYIVFAKKPQWKSEFKKFY